MYMWIFCCTHLSRWQDMTQYKLLILQTAHQFSGKAWLHYDTAFRKEAATSGLTNWSRMNSNLYNFHTRLPHPQQFQPPNLFSADPGIMAPVPGPMVNVGTVTTVKSVKESILVSTAPFGPQLRLLSAHGPPWSKRQRH